MGHLSGYGVPLNCSEHIQHNYGFITACNFVEGNRIAELFLQLLAMPKNNVGFFSTLKFFQVKFCKLFFSCRVADFI